MFTNSLNVISFDKTITIRTFLESCMILKVKKLAFVLNFNFDRHILNIPTMTFSMQFEMDGDLHRSLTNKVYIPLLICNARMCLTLVD